MAKAILEGNAVIGQSGGPTAVINQSLVGVIDGLRAGGFPGRVLGALNAVSGIVKNRFLDLTDMDQAKLNRIADTPSSALGSSRDKPDAEYCRRIFDAFSQQNVRYFFYIGGNDSSDTCRIIAEMAGQAGYDLCAYHVPKTIDNDLVANDHTPGWGSAAKFVAQAFMGDNLDNKALPGVKINVVMGRHAGFLTAASILGRQSDADGPHLVYVPEANVSIDKLLSDVDRVYRQRGRCLIAVSEGVHDEQGRPLAAVLAEQSGRQIERDAHGNVQLSGSGALGDFIADVIRSRLSIKRVRADTLGYLQRSFVGCTSRIDAKEARAVGRKAATEALKGRHRTGSISIGPVRESFDQPYKARFKRIEISDVAAKTRTLPPTFILDGCMISDTFRDYANPIVGPLPPIEQF